MNVKNVVCCASKKIAACVLISTLSLNVGVTISNSADLMSNNVENTSLERAVSTKAETLTDRALVAVNLSGKNGGTTNVSLDENGVSYSNGVYISWRSFSEDSESSTYTLYRNGVAIAKDILETNYIDVQGSATDTYKVVGSNDTSLGITQLDTNVWNEKYLELQLYKPANETMPDGTVCTFSANDMSVGDVDVDGGYELIVKWDPSNSQDNSKSGYTGKTYIDGYDINTMTGSAKLLWRIDLGVNIRSGAHYTQFQVWDFDNDGNAEIAMKTADGTTIYKSQDGTDETLVETGYVGACNSSSLPVSQISQANDYRNSSGYVLSGPEYFTMFDGETGTIIDTVNYLPARGTVSSWGDSYGNRVDRFLSAVAYLDGTTPSAVFARGYYTRSTMTAYNLVDTNNDGNGDSIQVYWQFDTNDYLSQYDKSDIEGQGNHGISINDVDSDGKDEIIYGSLVVDNDGTIKYTTGLGHGDAMHVSDWIPSNSGLEIMQVHEQTSATYHVEIHDANTGEILVGYYTGKDTGRGVAADIDPTSVGAEFWASRNPSGSGAKVYASNTSLGELNMLSSSAPAINFTLFWDGDLLSDIQDHVFNTSNGAYDPVGFNITTWDYENSKAVTLLDSTEVWSNNGTKGNACLVADILGDWREEVIVRVAGDNGKVRIYTTTIKTDYVIPTLMENLAYRQGIAWQNVAYNQPANLSYLLSEGVITSQFGTTLTTNQGVELYFTKASDGVYGHEVEGYEIYRSKNGEEVQPIDRIVEGELTEATVSYNGKTEVGYKYVDYMVEEGNSYEYKLCAIVNGRNSYMSKTTKSDIVPTQNLVDYKFDFGTAFLSNGWYHVSAEDRAYEETGTFGFTQTTISDSVLVNKQYTASTDETLKNIYNDCVIGQTQGEFIVKVPNGVYNIILYSMNGSTPQYNKYLVEGELAQDVRLGNTALNTQTKIEKQVTVTDGTLNIQVQSSKDGYKYIYFGGLEIKQVN